MSRVEEGASLIRIKCLDPFLDRPRSLRSVRYVAGDQTIVYGLFESLVRRYVDMLDSPVREPAV